MFPINLQQPHGIELKKPKVAEVGGEGAHILIVSLIKMLYFF